MQYYKIVNNTESTLSMGSGRGGLDDCEGESWRGEINCETAGNWMGLMRDSTQSCLTYRKQKRLATRISGIMLFIESDVHSF